MQEKEAFLFIKYFFILLNKFEFGLKRTIFGLFLMSVIGGFLELLGIAMIFPVMLVLTSSHSAGGEFILNWCRQFFPNTPELKIAFILSLFMIFVFLFKNIFMMICINAQNSFAKKWADFVNEDVVKKLLYAPYVVSNKIEYGDKVTLLSSIVSFVTLLTNCILKSYRCGDSGDQKSTFFTVLRIDIK